MTWSCVSSMVNFLNFYFAKVYLAIIETKVWQFIFAGNSLLWSVDMPANWGIKCNILAGRMLCPTYIVMILLSFCNWKKGYFCQFGQGRVIPYFISPLWYWHNKSNWSPWEKRSNWQHSVPHRNNLTGLCPQQKKRFFSSKHPEEYQNIKLCQQMQLLGNNLYFVDPMGFHKGQEPGKLTSWEEDLVFLIWLSTGKFL